VLRRLLLAALTLLALAPATADAAKRQVPRGWLGMDVDGPLMQGAYGTPDAEWNLLAGSGAETVRMSVRWPAAQPQQGMKPDLSQTDALVLAAAARGLRFLPVVESTPAWAARYPEQGEASPPRNPATYASFLRALVERYGPRGSLWREHPEVPKVPIREWQVWNEPNFRDFWAVQPFPKTFVPLLRAAYKAIHRADHGATVVLAGMANWSWTGLKRLYRAGGRGTFDAVALHPYTSEPSGVVRLVELARNVMRAYGDAKVPIWITELSFPAAKGKVDAPRGFETTQSGQVKRLKASIRKLAAARHRLRIARVFWYAWLTDETRTSSFSWSGLRRMRNGVPVSTTSLAAYRSAAKRLEGCAKRDGDARRCR
jgi:Glycosyl hydrolase catalytic core